MNKIKCISSLYMLSAAARDAAAKLCGVTVLAVKSAAVEAFLADLQEGFSDQDIKKHKFEVQDGYIAATGYVLAQTMTGIFIATFSCSGPAQQLTPNASTEISCTKNAQGARRLIGRHRLCAGSDHNKYFPCYLTMQRTSPAAHT